MNNEKLKPCPFCGGEAEIVMSGGERRVDCKKCGARSDWYDTEAEAIAAWNRRNYSVFPNSSKLTYADVEKMVKPLEWDGDTATLRLDGCRELVFMAKRSGQSDIFKAQIEIEGDIATIECGLAEEDAKTALQEFLVDLVADALGVERSK